MKIKSFLLGIAGVALSLNATAQDTDKIDVSAYVAPNSGVPQASAKVLEGKLNNIITAAGFGATVNQRFILTSRVNILTEDVTPTTPPMYAYTLSFDLYLGDGETGTLFTSTQVEAKGVGPTKDKAYLQALKALNPRDPGMKQFLADGKQKIVDYYLKNGPSIIQHAQMLAKNQNFDEAIYELSTIPAACGALYEQANGLMQKIYTEQITQQGNADLAEARAIWSAGMDRDAADKAGAILARINPQSPAYASAQALSKEISARVKAIDQREWNLTLQKQKDETAVRKAQLQATRDVAMAYAKNQPKIVYRIHWW